MRLKQLSLQTIVTWNMIINIYSKVSYLNLMAPRRKTLSQQQKINGVIVNQILQVVSVVYSGCSFLGYSIFVNNLIVNKMNLQFLFFSVMRLCSQVCKIFFYTILTHKFELLTSQEKRRSLLIILSFLIYKFVNLGRGCVSLSPCDY